MNDIKIEPRQVWMTKTGTRIQVIEVNLVSGDCEDRFVSFRKAGTPHIEIVSGRLFRAMVKYQIGN